MPFVFYAQPWQERGRTQGLGPVERRVSFGEGDDLVGIQLRIDELGETPHATGLITARVETLSGQTLWEVVLNVQKSMRVGSVVEGHLRGRETCVGIDEPGHGPSLMSGRARIQDSGLSVSGIRPIDPGLRARPLAPQPLTDLAVAFACQILAGQLFSISQRHPHKERSARRTKALEPCVVVFGQACRQNHQIVL